MKISNSKPGTNAMRTNRGTAASGQTCVRRIQFYRHSDLPGAQFQDPRSRVPEKSAVGRQMERSRYDFHIWTHVRYSRSICATAAHGRPHTIKARLAAPLRSVSPKGQWYDRPQHETSSVGGPMRCRHRGGNGGKSQASK